MNYSIGFWDRIAERYARKPVANEALYQKKLKIAQSYLKPDMSVLEFGCGTGSTALIHAEYVNNYRAIDVSPKMIEICHRKLAEKPISGLKFECSPVEALSLEGEEYDAVFGMSILHLMNDPDGAVKKVFASLKPGGFFISSTACIKDSMSWFGWVAKVGYFFRALPKIQVLSRDELESMLLRSGFDIDYRLETGSKSDAHFVVAKKPIK